MDLLILTNLPVITFFWTACTFCWGLYTLVSLFNLMNDACLQRGIRKTDKYSATFILLMCTLDVLYLLHEPITTSIFRESIVVINIFTNTYLGYATAAISKWRHVAATQTPHYDNLFKIVP